jgi:hypothetical protein
MSGAAWFGYILVVIATGGTALIALPFILLAIHFKL